MPRLSPVVGLVAISAFCLETVALSAPINPANHVPAGSSLVQLVDGCHANTRYHYVDEIGEEARHRHRGNNCRVQILERPRRPVHCHDNGQRHSHRGYGRVTHSHYQDDCGVDVWRKREGGGSSKGCIKVGPVLFCP